MGAVRRPRTSKNMELREYQKTAVEKIINNIDNKPILVAPTGAGKTVMLSAVVKRLNLKTLWVAHRIELIAQAREHLIRANAENITVMSIQTRNIPVQDYELIIIDECHHAILNSQYERLFKSNAKIIGCTATPFRLDGRGLGALFGMLIPTATPYELWQQGYLCSPIIYSHTAPDVNDIKTIGGDYDKFQLDNITNTPELVADLVSTWKQRALNKKTVCFAVSIKHSKHIVQKFLDAGIPAEHLDGETPSDMRSKILSDLKNDRIKIVSNVGIITEGFDVPDLEACILARPTASLALYLQMVGRILRPKDSAIILDHAGNVIRHGSPFSEIQYTLDTDKHIEVDPLNMKRCPTCFLLVRYGVKICPACGDLLTGGKLINIKIKNGELVLWSDKAEIYILEGAAEYRKQTGQEPIIINGKIIEPTEHNKQEVYEYLLKYALNHGYLSGWAQHRYRAIYGRWCKKSVSDTKKKIGLFIRKY